MRPTSSGHYINPLLPEKYRKPGFPSIALVVEKGERNLSKQDIMKLHRQFGHCSSAARRRLLKNNLERLPACVEKCQDCNKKKKPERRPLVCLPVSEDFNRVVALDLSYYNSEKWFLRIASLVRFQDTVLRSL